MDFKEFLAKKMSELGVSYRKLEDDTGISRGNLSRYMHGSKTPSVQTVYRLAVYISDVEAEYEALEAADKQLLKSAYIIGMVQMIGGEK